MRTSTIPTPALISLETCGGCGSALLSDQRITTYVDGVPEVFCSRRCTIEAKQAQENQLI